jgi:hypothetical protein
MIAMKPIVLAALIALGPVFAPVLSALTSQSDTLQSEVLISTLPPEDLKKQIAAPSGAIEHKAEVVRGGPVAVVLRTIGCMKDTAGRCNLNADVVVYRPDGSVFHEAKALDLAPTGRLVVPLNIDANAGTGLYKVAVRIRDMTARRFAEMERQFAVK